MRDYTVKEELAALAYLARRDASNVLRINPLGYAEPSPVVSFEQAIDLIQASFAAGSAASESWRKSNAPSTTNRRR